MNRALRPTTDEERAEQIAQDKILLFREGNWPDMHQEPDWLPGEAPPGTGLALAILFTIVGIVAFAMGWVVAGVIW